MEMLQGVWKQHLRPHAVEGYGVKIFLPSPPNYVTRSPGYSVVCGLSFSLSQHDFEGFLRAPWFLPSSKLTPSLNPICRTPLITVLCTEGLSWINVRN